MKNSKQKDLHNKNMNFIRFISKSPNSQISEMVIGRCISALKNCTTEKESNEIVHWINNLPETDVSSYIKNNLIR